MAKKRKKAVKKKVVKKKVVKKKVKKKRVSTSSQSQGTMILEAIARLEESPAEERNEDR